MAKFPHLTLERLDRTEDRRKPPAPVSPPDRGGAREYGEIIKNKIDAAAAEEASLPRVAGIEPELILKVELATAVEEDDWRRAGLTVLAQEPDGILILFATDAELTSFRTRLAEFQKGAQGDRKQPSYNGVFSSINNIGSLADADRIGPRLRADGIDTVAAIDGRASYTVDVELWDARTQLDRQVRVQHLVKHIEDAGGEILSRYVGNVGLIVLRARLRGTVLKSVLSMLAVARVDLRPVPDLGEREPPVVTLEDIPAPVAPPADAPIIGIIDSGSVDHPLLAPSLVESLGIPAALGTADEWGHGAKVAGIAAFGDLRECVDGTTFASPVRIISVKVVNERGEFDDTATIPEQMEEAIRALHARGCRIVNIALGDKHRVPYDGGRVSIWAATLDTLARELDLILVVSAGNSIGGSRAPWGSQAEHITRTYPTYLVSPQNRIVEPATAAIALTVGSIAHANGLPPEHGAELRAVAPIRGPTPITRSGPGANDAIKPDLADFGGTCLFDGMIPRIATGDHYSSAGMLTLRSDYLKGLLTSATGTSMAAPRVAYKAALLLRALPNASANLIRALLALSADVPSEATQCLASLGINATRQCLGNGVPDLARALDSEERRVVLVADKQELATDQFALFHVQLPKEFQTTNGERHIRVSLAFDPPVRHTRHEYLGIRLNYHLLRGVTSDEVFEFFRQRKKGEAKFEELAGTAKCPLIPSRDVRGTSTLQASKMTMKRNIDKYGDDYYLAVFADRRWAGDEITHQRFAIAVELEHEASINLYQQLRTRVRV